MVMEDNGGFKKGRIVEGSQDLSHVFHVANSYVDLLEQLNQNLQTGNYQASEKRKEIIR
jgi:hypothetical protein